jgi:dTDP-4-dehydrorhamnose reductase
MNILVTGANGFLGYYLVKELLDRGQSVVATGKGDCRLPFTNTPLFSYEAMDFTDPFNVHDVFQKVKPAVVVHAGAMTRPDECELNQWEAYTTNVEATMTLMLNAAEHGAFFILVSTDFVFDGVKGMYAETDEPSPVNFYGRTKLDAEEIIKEYEYDWAIVRTVLVYGAPRAGRENILTVVKSKLEKGEEYSVVDDQVRTPTYVEDLATGIVSIIEKRHTGFFHISGEEVLTPYQMAIRTADLLGLNRSLIRKVTAADFIQPANRPPRTGFDISKAKSELGFKPLTFEEGLRKTFSLD